MSNKQELLTPVGRLVAGSLYDAQTTDAEGHPRTIRTGTNAGQPRVDFYFAIAIEKGNEKHWSETSWGAKIWETAHKSFPGGQANNPSFAWKVQDGDNTIPNKAGRKNCDREGYPGNWILNFSTGFAPQIVTDGGHRQMPEPDAIKLGDYIEVFGSVAGNGAVQQPGVYLNHQMVNFIGYGERIILGVDPKSVGFGQSPRPAGVRSSPPNSGFNPAPTPAAPQHGTTATPAPAPYADILQPPVPGATGRVMLPGAGAFTYEQYIAQGWTDEMLIQHGKMQA